MIRRTFWTPSAAAIFAAALGVGVPIAAPVQAAPSSASPIAAAARQTTWQANQDDFLLLQIVVGSYKLNNEVRGYQTDSGVCLDLADVIQSLDLPVRLDKKSRRATGWLFAENQKFTLDREANTVQNVNTGTAPLHGEIHDTPEGWCVDTAALSRWFGVTLKPDLFNSAIRLQSDTKLPFIDAIERRSRAARLRPTRQTFDLSAYQHADSEYKVWRTPSVDVVARAGYNAGQFGTQDGPTGRYEVYAAGEVAGASFDARLSSDSRLKPQSLRISAYRYDASGGLLGGLHATQVVAGDVQTDSSQLTGQSAVGRGAYISNQPLGRQSRFSSTTVRGTLPAGWDAELYRNGQLIAFQTDTADGRYEFANVDLYYGQNDLEVVLYGPQGQIRREKFQFPVGRSNIEPGKTYYWAGILQNNHDLIDLRNTFVGTNQAWRGGAGVEHGLDQRTSIALAAHSFVLDGDRRNYLESNLFRTIGPMQAEFSAAYQFGGGTVVQANGLGRFAGINLGAQVSWVQGDFASEYVTRGLRREYAFNFDTSLKLGHFIMPLQGSIDHSDLRDGGKLTRMLMQTGFAMRGFALTAQLQRDVRNDPGQNDQTKTTQLRLLANTRQFGLNLRGLASFNLEGFNKGLQSVRLSTQKLIDDKSNLAADIEYQAAQKDTNFTLGYTRRFDRFALRGDASLSTSGAVGMNVALSFSFGPNPIGGGIRFSEKKLASNGQAAVTVFRDDNGDGKREPGEDLLKDVYVEAGLRTTDAITNKNGQAIVDDLRPYIPVLVGVDESSLGDPYLVPAIKGIVVTPRPGVSTVIEIPISPSGEVEGELQSPSGTAMSGVALELVDRRGAVVVTTMSEFDGFFLFERVPYGQYHLRVAAAAARTLSVRQAIGTALEVKRGSEVARLGFIRLVEGGMTIAQADRTQQAGAGVLAQGPPAPVSESP